MKDFFFAKIVLFFNTHIDDSGGLGGLTVYDMKKGISEIKFKFWPRQFCVHIVLIPLEKA